MYMTDNLISYANTLLATLNARSRKAYPSHARSFELPDFPSRDTRSAQGPAQDVTGINIWGLKDDY